MASIHDKRRANVQRSRAQWIITLAALCAALCAGYLLGRVAAGHGAYAATVVKSHAAVRAPAQSPDETAAAAAADPSDRQLKHEPAPLQIGIAVAVSAKPEHVSGQGCVAATVADLRYGNSWFYSIEMHCERLHDVMAIAGDHHECYCQGPSRARLPRARLPGASSHDCGYRLQHCLAPSSAGAAAAVDAAAVLADAAVAARVARSGAGPADIL